MHLNTEHFSLSSPLIRRALSCVIDRQQIVKHISIGDDPLFSPLPCFEQVTDTVNNDGVVQGKALFEKGLEDLGLTRETFPALKISSCGLSGHKRIAEYVQQCWENVFGIQVALDIQDWGTFYSNLKTGNYQVGGFFVSADYDDLLACFAWLSGENFSRWKHPQYQEVLHQIKKGEASSRSALFGKAEAILREEMPIIWIMNRSHYHSYPANLKGLCFDQRGIPDLRWAYFE